MLFILVALPIFSARADYCTNPSAYKTDRRCYATAKQRATKPFNAVVALVKDDSSYCTGTIVKRQNKLYVFTAKHCVANNSNQVYRHVTVRLQNGRRITATKNNTGNYIKSTDSNWGGDWAIYSIDPNERDVPYVNISDGQGLILDDARSIGYGGLKILSDAEIKTFKRKYYEYLINHKNIPVLSAITSGGYGNKDGALNTKNKYVHNYIYEYLDEKTRTEIFNDERLKVSTCEYSRTGEQSGCQAWSGNSGGGIFDLDGDIMGIHTRGNGFIGGKKHGKAGDSINLQPKLIENIFKNF